MISRDTGLTATGTASRSRLRSALYLTTAVAMTLPVVAHAAANITVSGTQTAGAAQGVIDGPSAGQSDINVTFDSTAAITGVAAGVFVEAGSPGAADSDGAITFVNNGKIGSKRRRRSR